MVHWKLSVGSVFLCVVTSPLARAQDVAGKKQPPWILLDFRDAALVQMAITEAPSITVVTSRLNQVNRSRTVSVTRLRKETRTRIVQLDGKPVEQSYVVSVPYTERVQQNHTVDDPVVNEPITIPIVKVAAWDSNGKKLDSPDLAVRVSKPAAALLLRRPWPKGAAIEPSHLALLRDDVVFLYSPELNKARDVVLREQTR